VVPVAAVDSSAAIANNTTSWFLVTIFTFKNFMIAFTSYTMHSTHKLLFQIDEIKSKLRCSFVANDYETFNIIRVARTRYIGHPVGINMFTIPHYMMFNLMAPACIGTRIINMRWT
jgi:hypothetical protein